MLDYWTWALRFTPRDEAASLLAAWSPDWFAPAERYYLGIAARSEA